MLANIKKSKNHHNYGAFQSSQKIISDKNYSVMLDEGSTIPVDEDSNYIMELPEWADEKKIRM